MIIFFAIASIAIVYAIYNFIYKKYWRKNLSVDLNFERNVCICGEENSLFEVVENLKALPISILRVRFYVSKYLDFGDGQNVSVSDKSYKNDIFSVLFFQRIKRKIDFTCRRRGFYNIDKIDIVSYNLFLKTPLVDEKKCNISLTVLPKFAPQKKLDAAFRSIYGQVVTTKAQVTDPFEFKGIRPYETFDSIRDINWKASAKSDELMVNVTGYTSGVEAVVILNTEPDTKFIDDRITEQCISICAGLCAKLIKSQIPTSLITNGTDCINGGSVKIESASGEGHIKTIRTALARLDCKNASPAENIFSSINHDGSKVYVVISSARKQSLLDCITAFANNCPITFVNVYKKGDEQSVKGNKTLNVLNWEIDRFDNI